MIGATGGLYANVEGEGLDIHGHGLTITAWVAADTISNTVWKTIASKWAANKRQYSLYIIGTGSSQFKFSGGLSSDGTDYTFFDGATTTYNDSTWYHLAFTYDSLTVRLYVNGALACTPTEYSSEIYNGAASFALGRRQYVGSVYQLQGWLDEVAVFDRVLSPTEISNIYTYGLTNDSAASDSPWYPTYATSDGVILPDGGVVNQVTDSLDVLCAGETRWQRVVFGKSAQKRDIEGVIITPYSYTKTIQIDAGEHGDETRMSLSVLVFLRYLKNNPAKYPHTRWVVAPLLNVDGATDSTCKNNNVDSSRQVNLNRNFPVGWGVSNPPLGAPSSTPSDKFYKGPRPESEPETQVLEDMIRDYQPDIHLDFHGTVNYMLVSDSSYLVEFRDSINHFLSARNFEPKDTMLLVPGTGTYTAFSYCSLGVKAIAFEHDYNSDPIEEVQRSVAVIFALANSLGDTVDGWIYASDNFCDSVYVEWPPVAAADSYQVRRDGSRIGVTLTDVLTFTDTTATVGTSYLYTVAAYNVDSCYTPTVSDYGQRRCGPAGDDDRAWRGLFRSGFRRLFR
jgi:hypothetical protein